MFVNSLYSGLYSAVSKQRLLLTLANDTGTTTGAEKRIDGWENLMFRLAITAMTGAGHTSDIKIQHRLRSTDAWADTGLAFSQVQVAAPTTTWTQTLKTDRPLLPRIRVIAVGGGTETTLAGTVSVVGVQGPRGRVVDHGYTGG